MQSEQGNNHSWQQVLRPCAVLGNPIAHSKSPQIHRTFAEQFARQHDYQGICVKAGELASTIRGLHKSGFIGLNITVPYKEAALIIADYADKEAELAGATNTLTLEEDGRIYAANTDGRGLLRDLTRNQGYSLRQKRILILGAGGSARGILPPLASSGAASITLCNRSHDRALALQKRFAPHFPIQVLEYSNLASAGFDLMINTTASSLQGERLPIAAECFRNCRIAVDLMYGKPSPFLEQAREQGIQLLVDGLGMLVEQAAIAFFIWHGHQPDTQPVLTSLRQELGKKCYQ